MVTRVLEKDGGYTSSIWLYDCRGVRQITSLAQKQTGRDTSPQWSPDGRSIAFLSGRSGKNQVWVLDLAGGEALQLTDMPKGVGDMRWSPDGTSIFLAAKEDKEEPKLREGATARRITRLRYKMNGVGYLDNLYTQLWRVDRAAGRVERLTEGPYSCGAPEPSPDGRFLAVTSARTSDETARFNDLWLLEVSTKRLTKLTRSLGGAYGPVWSTDGRSLFFLGHEKGDYPGGYPEVRAIDCDTLEQRVLSGAFPYLAGGGVGTDSRADGGSGLTLSADGSSLYLVGLDGGSSYVFSLVIATGQHRRVFGDGQMAVTSCDVAGDTLVVNKATPRSAGDLWIGKTGAELSQITRFNEDLVNDRYIGWPERVEFHHPDGTLLEGRVIKPAGFQEGGEYPLVFEIHGGPHSTFGTAFFHEFQILAGHGFGVLYTNPRGSMGYGESFARAVVGDWCGVDARDLEFMAEQSLQILPWADPRRFGVTGGSQGGYFTNWLIGHTGLFSAAVAQRRHGRQRLVG